MIDDFYKRFSEETEEKLKLFSYYLKEWFPVFLKTPVRQIRIIDLFCGPGKDETGKEGSPFKIIEVMDSFNREHNQDFKSKKIEILFNDKKLRHIEKLKQDINNNENISKEVKNMIVYKNREFKELFSEIKEDLKTSANLIFLDQFGIKEVTKDIFKNLFKIPKTDFIFFISSSSVKRFFDQDEFQEVWWMNREDIKKSELKNIHRIITEEYKQLAPQDAYVIPFTLKKETNIYGLIFCSKHILAADKFLHIAWKENFLNGEANFDIDEDEQQQLSLLEKKLTKIEAFENRLEKEILARKITNNINAYKFTISNGFLPKHAKKVIIKLKNDDHIKFDGRLTLTYKSCIKNQNGQVFY